MIQFGKIVSKDAYTNDKTVHIRKAMRTLDILRRLNEKKIPELVTGMNTDYFIKKIYIKIAPYLECQDPVIMEIFTEVKSLLEKLMCYDRFKEMQSTMRDILEHSNGYIVTTEDLTETVNLQITPSTSYGNEKFGHCSIIISPNKNNQLFDIQHLSVTVSYGIDKSNKIFIKISTNDKDIYFDSFDELISKIKRIRDKIVNKIDEAVSQAPAVPYKVPELLYKLMKHRYSDAVIIDCYSVTVQADIETEEVNVNVKPVSKLIKGPLTYIEVTDTISWYPEDTMARLLLDFAEINRDRYVVLKKDERLWVYNDKYGFWRYRIFKYYDKNDNIEKVYRTKYNPFEADGFEPYYSEPEHVLFRITKVTRKSAWLVPINKPIQFLLSNVDKLD